MEEEEGGLHRAKCQRPARSARAIIPSPPHQERGGEIERERRGETGGEEKLREAEAEGGYIFGLLDSDEKQEKRERMGGKAGGG